MDRPFVRLERVASLFSEGVEDEPMSFAARRKRREQLLRASPAERLRRLGAVVSFVSRRRRAGKLASAIDFTLRERLVAPLGLPDPRNALIGPDGLCGLARDLSPATVLEGYFLGLKLFGPIGPVGWWSPAARPTTRPGAWAPQLREALGLLRRSGLRASADAAFEDVAVACGRPDPALGRLGFGPRLSRAYIDLFDGGLAHSIEIVGDRGKALAGVFGLAVGRIFVSEACFGPPELARAALTVLDAQLQAQGFALHDGELGSTPGADPSPILQSLGFERTPRPEFIALQRASQGGCGAPRWRLCFLDPQPPFDLSRLERVPSTSALASLAA